MRKLLIIFLFLISCQKTLTTSPSVSLEVSYLSNQSFILKGSVSEECFRGFVISETPNAVMNDPLNFTYGYDTGIGDYSMALSVERNKTYYFRSWAIRKGDDPSNIGYSIEQSFKT